MLAFFKLAFTKFFFMTTQQIFFILIWSWAGSWLNLSRLLTTFLATMFCLFLLLIAFGFRPGLCVVYWCQILLALCVELLHWDLLKLVLRKEPRSTLVERVLEFILWRTHGLKGWLWVLLDIAIWLFNFFFSRAKPEHSFIKFDFASNGLISLFIVTFSYQVKVMTGAFDHFLGGGLGYCCGCAWPLALSALCLLTSDLSNR